MSPIFRGDCRFEIADSGQLEFLALFMISTSFFSSVEFENVERLKEAGGRTTGAFGDKEMGQRKAEDTLEWLQICADSGDSWSADGVKWKRGRGRSYQMYPISSSLSSSSSSWSSTAPRGWSRPRLFFCRPRPLGDGASSWSSSKMTAPPLPKSPDVSWSSSQLGFPCFLEPAISLPYLSTHQHWPVLP